MNVRVKFLGAAGSVTGSRFLIEADDYRFLFDCGLFQGLKDLRLRNWDPFPVDPSTIQAVVLSHAHIDHSGYLPKLVREGFNGPVYCTPPTADLLEIMLVDSAKLQEEETAYAIHKGYSRHAHPQPLYTEADAKAVFPLLRTYNYKESFRLTDNITVTFHDAGHLLGSAITEIVVAGEQQQKKIVFSGDLGRYHSEMLHPPARIEQADVLFVESTYGNKDNPIGNPEAELARIASETFARNGVLLIPAFSVGRTQSLLYLFRKLMKEDRIPDVPVYIDSPMALSATYLFFSHAGYLKNTFNLKEFAHEAETNMLVFVRSGEHSKSLNNIKSKAIIISSSGMMTGGRILHHLYHRLRRKEDTLLIAGFQAEGTRGRRILEGEKSIKIFGEEVPVECHLEYFRSMSGHADREELFRWMGGFTSKPKMVFTVHGEGDDLQAYAKAIRERLNWNVWVPQYLETVQLFEAI
ncbi:MAG: MBL fold metallo-hydrolase [Cyclobacteriaceae bacterium]|nr:MAG: MBL fold metallo-hydrolase [Cyclobacteriaceae bacterium]